MTYWPLSSPSVFAATKQTLPDLVRTHISDDGAPAEREEPNEEQDGATDDGKQGSVAGSEVTEGDNCSSGEELPLKEKGNGPRLRQHGTQLPEEDVSGEIIGIKVTRSGHMFATITRATLTIWQTKAGLSFRSEWARANGARSLRSS